MTPLAATTVSARIGWNSPTMMRNSPTNPFIPGSPIEERVMIMKQAAYRGSTLDSPPYSEMGGGGAPPGGSRPGGKGAPPGPPGGPGNGGTRNRRTPYAPILRRTAARMPAPAVGASTWASGSHVWNGNIGTLKANASAKAANIQNWSFTGMARSYMANRSGE